MRYRHALFALITAVFLTATSQTGAQEVVDLAELGYPELSVTVTDEGFEAPDTLPSGRYLVTLNNQGSQDYEMSILGIAEGGPTLDELVTLNATPETEETDDEEIPEWLTFNGGVGSLKPGTAGQVIADLAPGDYFLFTYLNEQFLHPLVVTDGDDQAAAAAPPADGTISLTEYSFTLPENLAAGQRIFEVTNAGAQWHLFQLIHLPDGLPLNLFEQVLMFEHEPATVPAEFEGYDLDQIWAAGGIGTLEPGATTWWIADLAPGTYGAVCFVEDENGSHAEQGMIAVFTVV